MSNNNNKKPDFDVNEVLNYLPNIEEPLNDRGDVIEQLHKFDIKDPAVLKLLVDCNVSIIYHPTDNDKLVVYTRHYEQEEGKAPNPFEVEERCLEERVDIIVKKSTENPNNQVIIFVPKGTTKLNLDLCMMSGKFDSAVPFDEASLDLGENVTTFNVSALNLKVDLEGPGKKGSITVLDYGKLDLHASLSTGCVDVKAKNTVEELKVFIQPGMFVKSGGEFKSGKFKKCDASITTHPRTRHTGHWAELNDYILGTDCNEQSARFEFVGSITDELSLSCDDNYSNVQLPFYGEFQFYTEGPNSSLTLKRSNEL